MIKDIISNNRYPIVFIGSGISKRYLKDFPNWEELLAEYWKKIEEKTNFYTFMRNIIKSSELEGLNETDKEFQANTLTASYIQQKFDDMFFDGKIQIPSLDEKAAYRNNISPFKYDLAQKFKTYEIIENMIPELKDFVEFIGKAKVIVTTNYDPFIENLLEEASLKPNIFVGQKGFFDASNDWGELYKIHGDISDPNSIVITNEDYKKYDDNSILISAKILVNMIESPIVFLGYSLSDRNVRKLLSDFASQLPKEDIRKTTNRIAIVEFLENESSLIEEMMRDQDLDIGYLLIRTDNYQELYNQFSEINEGLSPHDVLRYQQAIRNIVVSAGSRGKLDSVLVSPKEMEELEEQIREGKNIVVALGDVKNIFINPTPTNYLEDYVLERHNLLPANALRFVAKEGTMTRNPFIQHFNNINLDNSELESWEIERIYNKIIEQGHTTIDDVKNSVSKSNRLVYSSISDIMNLEVSLNKKIDIITFNAPDLNKQEFSNYVKEEALPNFISFYKERNNKQNSIKSSYRKLFVMWDIIIHGEIKKEQVIRT